MLNGLGAAMLTETNEEPQNVPQEEEQHGNSTGISTPMVTSREIASPIELAKANLGSRPSKHLIEMVSKEEFNTCAFFNPTIIQGHVCNQKSNFAIKHIFATVEAHK
nr:ulp1 protease family, C-terminal catalytic domain-containing protein [Tanacetum cinerariifolium]